MNIFGEKFTFTSFGESHGAAIGGVLDGVPARIEIDLALIRHELDRRAGRVSGDFGATDTPDLSGSSPRAKRERDEVEWLSGVMEVDGRLLTLGTPIAFLIRNTNAHPEEYDWLKTTYRPGHADEVYDLKYGIRDWRGGGRASARETASRVVAGTMAKQQLAEQGITISGTLAERRADDSGLVRVTICGLPVGTGEPIFDKLQAHLAFAVMSINGCTAFSYSGGIHGGIADGTPVTVEATFKAAPTTPEMIREHHMRSDRCIAVRAVPVVEAMIALVIADIQKWQAS